MDSFSFLLLFIPLLLTSSNGQIEIDYTQCQEARNEQFCFGAVGDISSFSGEGKLWKLSIIYRLDLLISLNFSRLLQYFQLRGCHRWHTTRRQPGVTDADNPRRWLCYDRWFLVESFARWLPTVYVQIRKKCVQQHCRLSRMYTWY